MHRKIGAYSFASQCIHLKVDFNNNNSCYPYSTRHMCVDLSLPHDAYQRIKIKRNREKNFDSLHKSKYIKVKDRPFVEGSRGCHALICLYAQIPQCKRTSRYIAPCDRNFIMQSVAFILCHPSSCNAQFSLTVNDLTLLETILVAFLHR